MLKFLFILTILFCSFFTQAGSAFFKDRYGKEVQFQYSGSLTNPRLITLRSNCDSEPCNSEAYLYEKFYDLVKAMKFKRIYRYTLIVNPCGPYDPWCDSLEKVDKDLPLQGVISSDEDILQRNKTAEKIKENLAAFGAGVVAGVSNFFGESSVNTLAKGISNGQGTNLNVFIIKSKTGAPISACLVDAQGQCTVLEEVIFSSNGDGSLVTVGMTVDPVSSSESYAVQNAVVLFMQSINGAWRCISTGTGNDGHIKWTMTCGYFP